MFPSSTLFHYPILLLLADGKIHTRSEMVSLEIKKLSISVSDQKVLTPKGVNKVVSWTSYAIADLKKAEYIDHCDKGYIITKLGIEFFEKHKNGFVAKDLKVSSAYRKYKNIKDNSGSKVQKSIESNNNEPKIIKDEGSSLLEGYVYILTNPAFKTFYIKIGYTTNIQERLKELYNTSVPMPFKVFALLKTTKYKQAEKMIHSACKSYRIGDDREFFMINPDDALEQMKIVAEGLDAIIIVFDEKGNEKKRIDYKNKK